jgi:hypothetical protein
MMAGRKRYLVRMLDAMRFTALLLLGSYPAPTVHWPPERVHVYTMAPDLEPDLVLDPLTAEPAPLRPLEVDVLAVLARDGTASEREIALALDLGRQRVRTGLQALKTRGLVRMTAKGWRTA